MHASEFGWETCILIDLIMSGNRLLRLAGIPLVILLAAERFSRVGSVRLSSSFFFNLFLFLWRICKIIYLCLTYCNIKRPIYVDIDTTKFVKKIVSIYLDRS